MEGNEKSNFNKDPLVVFRDVTVIRNSQIILDNVSLDVKEKDFLTIIGPNGAGKSMLLGCLMGFVKIQKGWIKKKPDLKIGFVPQSLSLDKTMPLNVKQFVILRKNLVKSIFDEVVEETGIADLLSRSFFDLSGGEKQRVILARALMERPQLLVLDEPVQNLDIILQLSFYKLIDKIYRQKTISIVMVSHDLHLVMSSTKRVICLSRHICCSGQPQDVKNNRAFTSAFGKSFSSLMKAYYHDHHILDEEENEK